MTRKPYIEHECQSLHLEFECLEIDHPHGHVTVDIREIELPHAHAHSRSRELSRKQAFDAQLDAQTESFTRRRT